MTVSLPIKGGCQCGSLRYELTAPPITIACCHCTNCQKISGSAFAINAMIAEDALVFTKGVPKKTEWTSDSGNHRYGLFCGDCGGRIAHGQTPPSGVFSLRVGTFDDASWVRPAGHIWLSSAQSWISVAEDDLHDDKQPENFGTYAERFRSFGFFKN